MDDLNRLIVYDFDDTLVPTSVIMQYYDHDAMTCLNMPQDIHNTIVNFEHSIKALISSSKKKGCVMIITNASKSWVEWVIITFYPKLMQIMRSINVICNVEIYKKYDKSTAFDNVSKMFEEVVTVGDNINDIDAASQHCKKHEKICKGIKFTEVPSLSALHAAHQLLIYSLDYIFAYESTLMIQTNIQRQEYKLDNKENLPPVTIKYVKNSNISSRLFVIEESYDETDTDTETDTESENDEISQIFCA